MGRGFSLIELAAVVVIVAIMGVTASMSMSGVSGNRQTAAARQIARDLAWLRERAMSNGTTCWATFTVATNTYVLKDESGSPGFASAAALTDPATGRAFSQVLNTGNYAGVSLLSATTASFGFDPKGRPVDTSGAIRTANVTIGVTGGRSATVTKSTGWVTWQ